MGQLNPTNVPTAVRFLLPMAEKWGIGDDFEREERVGNATSEELDKLIHCIDGVSDDELFGWLSGPESYNPNPTQEYIAYTCLTMAIDSAKIKERTKPKS